MACGPDGAPPVSDVADLADLATRRFAAPEPFARPIDDWLEAVHPHARGGSMRSGIHDLALHDGRLYLAFGDADRNLGDVRPADLRYLADPDSPRAVVEREAPEHEFRHLRRYGDTLFAPGLDAVGGGFGVHLYRRASGGAWQASAPLPGGAHVHDVAPFAGALWAGGTGGLDEGTWVAGRQQALLWRSDDGGAHFRVAARADDASGTPRVHRLLAAGERLLAFGYSSAGSGPTRVMNGALADGRFAPLPEDDPLAGMVVAEADAVGEGRALLRGAPSLAERRRVAWLLEADGTLRRLEAFDGSTVADVFVHDRTGETLLLVIDGDAWPREPGSWNAVLYATRDFRAFHELARAPGHLRPISVAAWEGRLYFGTLDGALWRSVPEAAR